MRRTLPRLTLLAIAGLGLCLAGCEGRTKRLPETGATLEGTVTYGKDKVEVAMVIVQGEGGAATAFIGEDGRYKAENVPLGTVNIAVNTEAGKGELMSRAMARSQGQGQGPLPKVIDVPANDFGKQEPGTNAEIAKFCEENYKVKFPMLSKVVVKGEDQTPLYKHLTSKETNPKFGGEIKWNFTKFLIARDGEIVGRFEPKVEPNSDEMKKAVEAQLAKK